ncbi:hypothetical protein GF386_04455 [Candidatus Pacearchaeota archaeon]|nr:hypothetical protein [Candidatus Pacearchaeota archaeon]MBD3283376.1 hypothetical protein [Candidatus Pacearchaeota archaeon]
MIIDISYPFHEDMLKYPSDPSPEIVRTAARVEDSEDHIIDESGFGSGCSCLQRRYRSGFSYMQIRNHHSTHIDAPSHKIPGGKTIDSYEIEKFINSFCLVDLTQTDLSHRKKREIRPRDLEGSLDLSPETGAVILYTGFCDEMQEHTGDSENEKLKFEKSFPYLTSEAAEYILSRIQCLNIIGIDSFSVDPSGSNSEVHRLLFARDVLPLETLFNLGKLRDSINGKTCRLLSVPISFKRGDAAPVRAYAEI